MDPVLTSSQRTSWERDGFVVLPEFVDNKLQVNLRNRIAEIVADYSDSGLPDDAVSVFSTTEQTHAQDNWFLSSGNAIRPFLEKGALDGAGNQIVPMDQALNKLGHAMHDLDPVFDRFSRTPALASLAADLGFVDPLLVQSMVIFKPNQIGGEVICHCDHSFLWTEPQTVVGFLSLIHI